MLRAKFKNMPPSQNKNNVGPRPGRPGPAGNCGAPSSSAAAATDSSRSLRNPATSAGPRMAPGKGQKSTDAKQAPKTNIRRPNAKTNKPRQPAPTRKDVPTRPRPQANSSSRQLTPSGGNANVNANTKPKLRPPSPLTNNLANDTKNQQTDTSTGVSVTTKLSRFNGMDSEKRGQDLISLITRREWSDVADRVKTYPLEAQRCHYLDGIGGTGIQSRALPLHFAMTMQPPSPVVQALVGANSSAANAKESVSGKLPLHIACMNGASLNCLKILIFVSRDSARTLDTNGRLPLHYICEKGSVEEISLLLESAPSSAFIKDKRGMNALTIAKRSNNPNLEAIRNAMRRYRLRALEGKGSKSARINKGSSLKDQAKSSNLGWGKHKTLEEALRCCDITVLTQDDIISDDIIVPEGASREDLETLARIDEEDGFESFRDLSKNYSAAKTNATTNAEKTSEPKALAKSNKTSLSGLTGEIDLYEVAPDDGSIEPGDEDEIELDRLLQKLDTDRNLLEMSQTALQKAGKDLGSLNSSLSELQKKGAELKEEAESKRSLLENSKRKIVAKKKLILELMEEIEKEEKNYENLMGETRRNSEELESVQALLTENETKKAILEREQEHLNRTYLEQSQQVLEEDMRLEELLKSKIPDELK